MASKLIKQTYCPSDNSTIKEFLCDTDADFETLPKCSAGSMAVSIESGKVMVVNTSGEWVEFGVPAKESIVGTWRFNDTLTELEPNVSYRIEGKIIFNGDEMEFNTILRDKPSYYDLLNVKIAVGGNLTLYDFSNVFFSDGYDKSITFTGGKDIDDADFITWLNENATKVG